LTSTFTGARAENVTISELLINIKILLVRKDLQGINDIYSGFRCGANEIFDLPGFYRA